MDGAQYHPTADEALVRKIQAGPMKVMLESKDDPTEEMDVLTPMEIDQVVEYMRHSLHDPAAIKRARAQVKPPHWWDNEGLITGKFEKKEFVEGHGPVADWNDGPMGADPPTWDFPHPGANNHTRLLTKGRNF